MTTKSPDWQFHFLKSDAINYQQMLIDIKRTIKNNFIKQSFIFNYTKSELQVNNGIVYLVKVNILK